jgi:CMP-N,N'-diacetyllegionaminic acid synthase
VSNVVALVPARSGSKGIPGKNWRTLGGRTLISHAAQCGSDAGADRVVVSTDDTGGACGFILGERDIALLRRPASLAQDDTPMYDVVKHAVETLKLAADDIVVLLQPTQPFRRPEHVTRAVQMLRETNADSVVSVVPLPLTHCSSLSLQIHSDGVLYPALCRFPRSRDVVPWMMRPKRRQDVKPEYKPDGTVYAFWVKTLKSGTLYGSDVRPLILDPSETCDLDTEEQWREVEARWSEQHG